MESLEGEVVLCVDGEARGGSVLHYLKQTR